MAYFLVAKKKDGWKFPDVVKLDLRMEKQQKRRDYLMSNNEFFEQVPYSEASSKVFAIVDGRIMSVFENSPLKVKALKRIVEDKIPYEKAKEVLSGYKFKKRKQFVENE